MIIATFLLVLLFLLIILKRIEHFDNFQHPLFNKYPYMRKHGNQVKFKKINYMFRKIVKIFNKYPEVKYWCMYGTLLGLHRDKYILPWDYDIDFGMNIEDLDDLWRNEDLKEDLRRVGLELKLSKNNTLKIYRSVDIPKNTGDKFYKGTTHADIYLYKKKGEYLYRGCFYDWSPIYCNKWIGRQRFLYKNVYPLKKVYLKNYNLYTYFPKNVPKVLEVNYPDWRKPKYTHV